MENKAAQMDKVYNPQAIEGELYKEWEETGAFVAHREEGKKPFTIVMPPPNITGQLHMKGTCHHRLCVGGIGTGMIVTVS